jgi:predicted oxidoreductase
MTLRFFARSRNAVFSCLIAGLFVSLAGCGQKQAEARPDAQAIVIGAGLSGLSAAVEMGRSGVEVLVVDMNSVAGGHTVLAGGVALVGTSVQERAGIQDSPDLAYRDWMAWTEDGDPEWTRFYADNSREMIYDWVTEMGVEFIRVAPGHGNSVPRFHFTRGRAVHLVLPIFRTALAMPNVSFLWNTGAENLLVEDRRISGVVVRELRSGEVRTLRAPNVVLATGGFESDLERVLANWTPGLPQPDRLLIGSAISATGSGHDMASDAGAALARIDRHYIYVNGVVDPRDPERTHALTAGNDQSMWVNEKGRRFTNETGFDKDILVDLLQQEPSSYWMIFDETARDGFRARGAAWLKNSVRGHPILDNPKAAKRAQSLLELAAMTGLPADALVQSVQRFNAMIEVGKDTDFGRFSRGDEAPFKIEQAPFYAVQMFPMTRKNMGGVAIDRQARALDHRGQVFPGLYAVGELNGSLGINGKHGLDGMFLGPAILTGRLAGRSIAAAYAAGPEKPAIEPSLPAPDAGNRQAALTAEDLESLLADSREGYWHFQVSHHLVLERGYACARCHSAQLPFAPLYDLQSVLAQTEVCTNCH